MTKRLFIRLLSENDADFIVALLNEPDFIRFIGDKKVNSLEQAVDYINTQLANQVQHGFCLYAVTYKNEAIGLCGLVKREQFEQPDLGYAYLAKYYRQGFGKEAAQAVLQHFAHYRPLLAITSVDNKGSQALLSSVGFKPSSHKNQDEGTQLFKLT